ncbi:hypothetical protein IWX75_000446 [Arthrobacter sp. CAN_A6]
MDTAFDQTPDGFTGLPTVERIKTALKDHELWLRAHRLLL